MMMAILAVMVLIAGGYYISQMQSQVEFSGTRENVTICFATSLSGLIPIAHEQNFFSQNGLDVTLKKFPIGVAAFEGLFIGECDIATVAETPIVLESFIRNDFAILASISTSTNFSKIVTSSDRGIHKANDLKGKRIATQKGTFSDFFLHVFLVKNGISEKNVTIVFEEAGIIPLRLAEGEIDAFSLGEPYISRTQILLGDKTLVFSEPGVGVIKVNLVALRHFIRDRPEVIDRTLMSLIQAEKYVNEHPDATFISLSKKFDVEGSDMSDLIRDTNFEVSLDEELLLVMEDQARWAINNNRTNTTEVPNYLEFIRIDNLERIEPKAVTMIH